MIVTCFLPPSCLLCCTGGLPEQSPNHCRKLRQSTTSAKPVGNTVGEPAGSPVGTTLGSPLGKESGLPPRFSRALAALAHPPKCWKGLTKVRTLPAKPLLDYLVVKGRGAANFRPLKSHLGQSQCQLLRQTFSPDAARCFT